MKYGHGYDTVKTLPSAVRWALLGPIVLGHLATGFALAVAASALHLSGGVQEAIFGASFLTAAHSATEVAPAWKLQTATAFTFLSLGLTAWMFTNLFDSSLSVAWWFFAFALAIGSLLCLLYLASAVWIELRRARASSG